MSLARGYDSYGASIHTTAARHLELTLRDVEPADLAIEAVAFLPHEGPPRPTLEYLLEQHILKYPQQVRVRYRAKVGKLDIEFPSGLTVVESFGTPRDSHAGAHVLPRALDELSWAVFAGLRLRPAIWSKIDVSRLTEAIDKARVTLPDEPDRIFDYMRQLDEADQASSTHPASIDELDVDWAQYHPAARVVLNSPFFWSEFDDDSPHGNDTGSDLLAAFKRWNKRNPAASYEGYVDRLLSRWGVPPETACGLDEAELHLIRQIRQEADIALAFAAIKLRGSCGSREARVALDAIEERLEQFRNVPARAEKLLQLRAALEASAFGA